MGQTLSEPVTEKESAHCQNDELAVSVCAWCAQESIDSVSFDVRGCVFFFEEVNAVQVDKGWTRLTWQKFELCEKWKKECAGYGDFNEVYQEAPQKSSSADVNDKNRSPIDGNTSKNRFDHNRLEWGFFSCWPVCACSAKLITFAYRRVCLTDVSVYAMLAMNALKMRKWCAIKINAAWQFEWAPERDSNELLNAFRMSSWTQFEWVPKRNSIK